MGLLLAEARTKQGLRLEDVAGRLDGIPGRVGRREPVHVVGPDGRLVGRRERAVAVQDAVRPDLDHLTEYVARLKAMDDTAGLGIFSDAHKRLHALANRSQVVYKPCGAGGGDIGIAVSDDSVNLDKLIALAIRDSFLTLDLEIAAHGVHRSRS